MNTTEATLQVAIASAEPLLQRFTELCVFPGAVVAVAACDCPEAVVLAVGAQTYASDARLVADDTLYDLASVTKLIAAGAVAMALVADGALSISTRVGALIPEWTGGWKSRVTIGHLLSHTSGLGASGQFYRESMGVDAIRARVKESPLLAEPGACCIYSDLGIILLGEALERAAGIDFSALVDSRVLSPLGLRDTMFNPPALLATRVAPTEDDSWRGCVVQGVVHDENAFAMGGIAPHAGLFSTARDVAFFGRSLLPGATPRFVPEDTVEQFTSLPECVPGPWAFGVRLLADDPIFKVALSPRSYGLTGFTGTLLAVDPERRLAISFLSNRVHPTRANRGVYAAQGLVLGAVLHEFDALTSS